MQDLGVMVLEYGEVSKVGVACVLFEYVNVYLWCLCAHMLMEA